MEIQVKQMPLETAEFDVAKHLNLRDSGWCAALRILLSLHSLTQRMAHA
jgi:hypothetical protein